MTIYLYRTIQMLSGIVGPGSRLFYVKHWPARRWREREYLCLHSQQVPVNIRETRGKEVFYGNVGLTEHVEAEAWAIVGLISSESKH